MKRTPIAFGISPIDRFRGFLGTAGLILLCVFTTTRIALSGEEANSTTNNRPTQAIPFGLFSPQVKVHWDSRYLFVESDGMPSHGMMVGISNWQQQVPIPQDYSGSNAWQIPLNPMPSTQPTSIKDRFLRGAIALAANGIPIFNPQNNRGEIAQQIGELDQWGGHCGRADDYHYHAAPLHLQSVVGKGMPIAYALDGYAIYGLTEPDGSTPKGLDQFNGHTTPSLGYHYHASTNYPYVNGGFHGTVVERDGQVDPQPKAHTIRGAGSPLRGARITGFEKTGPESYRLTYEINGETRTILYSVQPDGSYPFEYQNGSAGTVKETYRQGTSQHARVEASDGGRRAGPNGTEAGGTRPTLNTVKPTPLAVRTTGFILGSPVVQDGGIYPVEFTGDGAGISPPLEWRGAPAGTKSLALVMHHLDPEGNTKNYWILYNIPTATTSLEKNSHGVGIFGINTINNRAEYAPPHSKGPGPKTYVITLYALSEAPVINNGGNAINAEALLAAIKDHVLGTTELSFVYTRSGTGTSPEERPMRQPGDHPPPPGPPRP